MDLRLQDKIAIVTGGASGIGEAVAKGLAAENATVAIVDRDKDRTENTCATLPGVHGFVADLTNETQCRNAVQAIAEQFGGVDILVNNAGVNDGIDLNAGPAAFHQSLHKNLLHVYSMAHFSHSFLRKRQGCIVNIGSKVATTGQGGTSGYAAAKGAINALTREWAVEMAAEGVRVNTVIPAEVWTPLYERCLAEMSDPLQARRSIEQVIPLGSRFTTAEEIADTVVFLCSPRSSHTTGQILYVDGGYSHLDRKCTHPDIAEFGGAR